MDNKQYFWCLDPEQHWSNCCYYVETPDWIIKKSYFYQLNCCILFENGSGIHYYMHRGKKYGKINISLETLIKNFVDFGDPVYDT